MKSPRTRTATRSTNAKSQSVRLVIHGTLAILTLWTTSVSANLWECGERSNLPIEGRNYCAAGDFRQTEVNLGKLLSPLLEKHKVSFGDNSALRNAQSDFESYRDNQCEAENKRIEDKPYHPMIVAQCKTRLTNARIDELKRMIISGN